VKIASEIRKNRYIFSKSISSQGRYNGIFSQQINIVKRLRLRVGERTNGMGRKSLGEQTNEDGLAARVATKNRTGLEKALYFRFESLWHWKKLRTFTTRKSRQTR
jgi:hypothetical protein